ncbi:MAG: recombinase [Chloroflexi bacterium HGW-Chloroflexi-5]|jgi:integrase/recombinase XerC|nr:MAG: recombinase [Chloroflexi bacterium HGW-Chloroflexi-5]
MDYLPFEKYLEGLDRSSKTVEGYLQDLRLFEKWFEQTNGEKFSPKGFTSIDGREYRSYLLTVEKAAAATINRKIAALRAFGAWTVSSNYFDSNPLASLHGIKEQNAGIRWLDKKEQSALLRQLDKDFNAAKTESAKRNAIRNRSIVILFLNSGLRIGELCDLAMDDVDLSERKGSIIVREGKGRKMRTIPLNLHARAALTEWLSIRGSTSHSEVFSGQRGNALTPNAIQRFLDELARICNIEATPHSLRHTFCKNLINAGVTIEKVAAIAGHESIQSTRRYIEPSANDLERAVATLDN